jgi:phosphoribosylaminoimidazole-succinocarboxamide synthase
MNGLLISGMVKNQKLSANILTPTTKAVDHDVPVTSDEVFILILSVFFTYNLDNHSCS